MSKPRPPYLHRTVNRHGNVAWYVWRRPGPKIRIRGEYGSKDFLAAYRAALYGRDAPEIPAAPQVAPGTLSELIRDYRASPAWRALSAATQKQRANIFERIERDAGAVAAVDVDRAMVVATRDAMSGPGAAKHLIQTLRGLFQWALDVGNVDVDPTAGIKVARPQTEGFHTWTEEEIRQFENYWPVGRRERLWFAILLYTGLRRGDAVRLGPPHVKDGVMVISADKTGVTISLPMAKELLEIIALSKIGDQTFIATVNGAPMSKEFFGNLFREACNKAGLSHCSAHGLRKAAATRLAVAGATVPELNAVFGWTGAKQALLYTSKADRARMARAAVEKLRASYGKNES